MTEKISLVTFTDPMMGLSYECEPIFRKLKTHFPDRIEFHYVMCVLVRDVYEFVTPDEMKLGNDAAIKSYNARLAEIYKYEENFMYNLRYATIVDCRPTTKLAEILKVAMKTGLDVKNFLAAYNDGRGRFKSDGTADALQRCDNLNFLAAPKKILGCCAAC